MEIKAKLNKPYTGQQRINFIVENNHKAGLLIEETSEAIIAKGFTEEEKAIREKERIRNLTCTKRNFALMLQKLGITYHQLKELISTNEQALLEWDLCVELERSNPLIDMMGTEMGISAETIDRMFMYANGEVETI